MVPPAATIPSENASSYLSRRIAGTANLVIAVAAAMLEPLIAALPLQATTVEGANPPCSCPSQLEAMS